MSQSFFFSGGAQKRVLRASWAMCVLCCCKYCLLVVCVMAQSRCRGPCWLMVQRLRSNHRLSPQAWGVNTFRDLAGLNYGTPGLNVKCTVYNNKPPKIIRQNVIYKSQKLGTINGFRTWDANHYTIQSI